MSSVKAADLYAGLGLRPDKGQWAAGDRLISGIKTGLAAIAGFAGVRWATGIVADIANTTDHFAKLSQSTGVGIEALQELAYAGDLSGVKLEGMATALNILNKNLYDASRGGKMQAQSFRALGITVRDASGNIRPGEEVLGDIADRFAKMPDGAKKSALAMKLLGKSGATMVPLLNGGRAALEEMRQEARELGIVVDGETAKAFEKFNDDQTRLKMAWRGVKTELVSALLPSLQAGVSAVLAWVKANRKLIATRITQVFKILAGILKVTGAAMGKILELLGWLIDKFGVTAEIVGGLVGSMLLLQKAFALFGTMGGAAVGSLAGPLVLIAGLITGLVLLLKDVTFDEIKNKAAEFIAWARNAAKQGLDTATDALNEHVAPVIDGAIRALPGGDSAIDAATDLLMGRTETNFFGDGPGFFIERVPLQAPPASNLFNKDIQPAVDPEQAFHDVMSAAANVTAAANAQTAADARARASGSSVGGSLAAMKQITVHVGGINIAEATDPETVGKVVREELERHAIELADDEDGEVE